METTLKNSLFRFITFRAPEYKGRIDVQTAAQNMNLGASNIYKKTQQGVQLSEAAKGINAWTTEEQLRSVVPAQYDFAQWLATNRTTLTKDTLAPQQAMMKELPDDVRNQIWENLFYQIGTQQSMYLKDRLLELIIGDNFVQQYKRTPDGSDDQLRRMAQAHVIIPKELFGKDTDFTAEGEANPASRPFTGNALHNNTIDLLIAKDEAVRIETAIAAVKSAGNQVVNDDQDRKEEALGQYNKQLNAIIRERTAGWVFDPKSPGNLPYNEDELPTFDYRPAPEMEQVVENLPSQAQHIVSEHAAEVSTTGEATRQLQQALDNTVARIFKLGSFADEVVVAGGVPMPVATLTEREEDRTGYSLKAFEVEPGLYKIALAMRAAGKNTEIISGDVTINGKSLNAKDQAALQSDGNTLGIVLGNKEGMALPSSGSFPVALNLSLNDGTTRKIETLVPVTGLTDKTFTGTWIDTVAKDGGPRTIDLTPNPAPSTYGIKKLGIADYRKVEQTICCYVPGEVSHIENIMAREYKERSTRNLRRTEDTTTIEKQNERERLTDTTSTERYELQQETASVLNEQRSLSLSAGVNAQFTGAAYTLGVSASGNYASSTSKQQSLRLAQDFARETTERASEKVIQKVREERVLKIIEEFEEQNKHGFDNRGDDAKNISGVYRWVDKIYKNQIINYGKRLMYEFMIPQPASFHKQAMSNLPFNASVIQKPVDPATTAYAIRTPKDITRANYAQWVALYGSEVEAPPADSMSIGKSFSWNGQGDWEKYDAKEDLSIPDGYYAVSAGYSINGQWDLNNGQDHTVSMVLGNSSMVDKNNNLRNNKNITGYFYYLDNYEKNIPVSVFANNFVTFNANVTVNVRLSSAVFEKWQVDTFNAIMKAYNQKLDDYNEALAKAKAEAEVVKLTNPLYYRQIESTVLKKNCVAYMVGQSYMGGQSFTAGSGSGVYAVPSAAMDKYASVARFMEQAFEWEIMSYSFFPFYWGEKAKWNEVYTFENDDPLFRAFMQSGMARVIVTVRPGFEEAVMYYLATGQVWNGGQVPVINDPLYLSIVDELKTIEEKPEGDPWETKVPTSLTVIQNSTVGLDADGLPCDDDCADEKYFFGSDLKLSRLKKAEE